MIININIGNIDEFWKMRITTQRVFIGKQRAKTKEINYNKTAKNKTNKKSFWFFINININTMFTIFTIFINTKFNIKSFIFVCSNE